MTLNVDGLPSTLAGIPVNPNGPGADGTKRVSSFLAEKACDIIAIQEDFNYDRELRSQLDEHYNCGIWQGGIDASQINWLHLSSTKFATDGLRLFWRKEHSADNETCHPWTVSYGKFDHAWDDIATKGFRHSLLTLANGFRLHVYDLHMDASSSVDVALNADAKDREARRVQWRQLRDHVLCHLDESPFIIMGDMNSLYTRDSLRTIFIDAINAISSYTVADAWVELCLGGRYPSLDEPRLNPSTLGYEQGEIYDKVLFINPTRGPHLIPLTYTVCTDYVAPNGRPLGDHYPVRVTFSIDDTTDAPTDGITTPHINVTTPFWFTLGGQRLLHPTRPSIYLHNGRLVKQ